MCVCEVLPGIHGLHAPTIILKIMYVHALVGMYVGPLHVVALSLHFVVQNHLIY